MWERLSHGTAHTSQDGIKLLKGINQSTLLVWVLFFILLNIPELHNMSCGVTDLEKLARTCQLLTGSRLHFSGV